MKLLGSTGKDVSKGKNWENVPKLEKPEAVLMHCNMIKNNYQQTQKVLFIFLPNKAFEQLINILPHF